MSNAPLYLIVCAFAAIGIRSTVRAADARIRAMASGTIARVRAILDARRARAAAPRPADLAMVAMAASLAAFAQALEGVRADRSKGSRS